MPVVYDPADANRVLLEKDQAQQVWTALKNDRPIPASATEGTAAGGAKGVVNACAERPRNRNDGRPRFWGVTASPGRLVRRPRFTLPAPRGGDPAPSRT